MTNLEHFHDELMDIWTNGSQFSVDKKTGKPVDCCNFTCGECLLSNKNEGCIDCTGSRTKWLKEEYVELVIVEIDWERVPVDTKIVVYDVYEKEIKRHFAGYDSEVDSVKYYAYGSSSWNSTEEDILLVRSKCVKLFDPEDVERYRKFV